MFSNITDFITHWAYETEVTLKTFRSLTDASLEQRVTASGRTLGFLAWHIVITPGEMLSKVGLEIDGPAEDSVAPSGADQFTAAYEKVAGSVSEAVIQGWTDATLVEKDEMYGETWSRGQTLFYLTLHQTHHRGQMTVLMRQAGLAVPGAYGPSLEEWAAMGAPAMP